MADKSLDLAWENEQLREQIDDLKNDRDEAVYKLRLAETVVEEQSLRLIEMNELRTQLRAAVDALRPAFVDWLKAQEIVAAYDAQHIEGK